MAVRDLFAAVARPPVVEPVLVVPTDFRTRWDELKAVVLEKWGQPKLYWLEMKLAEQHTLMAASKDASNAAWSAALDDLAATETCPHNLCAWMASAVRRAIEAEKHKPAEHRADDGDVAQRRDRAFRRIAHGRAGAP